MKFDRFKFSLQSCFLSAVLCISTFLHAQTDFSELSPKQRIAIAEQEQVDAATDATFQEYMQNGHDYFKSKHYLKAIRVYEKAQNKRPYNVYPKVKITDIELSMADTLDQLREAEQKELAEQKPAPKPQLPQNTDTVDESKEERLQKLNDWEEKERKKLAAERERKNKKPESAMTSGGDVPKVSLEEYQKELAEKFPSGITEETYIEGNKSITRRVVVTAGKGNEYKRVEHNWGGVFFFKNGEAVTERVWKSETEK
jgi:hypothetical protein